MPSSWKCFLCWKLNQVDATLCACCRREKSYGPKSVIDVAQAQPLALHGLSSAKYPFREDQIQALAAAGLELTASDTNGWTALHCAARLGHDEVVQNLLNSVKLEDRPSFIEAASAGGWRAVHHAIVGGHLRVVEELLLANASLDSRLAPSDDGLTPLHLAAKLGHARIVDLLLQCGAEPTSRTQYLGRTALHLAIDGGPHVGCVRLLCGRTDLVFQRDSQGLSPLQQAHLLPPDSACRREMVDALETALRERGAAESPLLSAFLTK